MKTTKAEGQSFVGKEILSEPGINHQSLIKFHVLNERIANFAKRIKQKIRIIIITHYYYSIIIVI